MESTYLSSTNVFDETTCPNVLKQKYKVAKTVIR